MSNAEVVNTAAPGISYFTPLQQPAAGSAATPQNNDKPIPKLFQPLKIRGVEFHNRIFLAPLCQYSSKDGFVSPWHLAHLGGIFTRGPGLSMMEATAVTPEGRITPEDAGIWSDAHIQPLAKIVEFAHSQNQKIGIQLAHAGRKASTFAPWLPRTVSFTSEENGGWPDNLWAPSSIPYAEGSPVPKELTKEGIQRVISAFADAAKRAVQAGFDVIEIHSAHGFLLQSFLSPMTNKRTDKYGGSFENRIRLTVEVVDAIRDVIPEKMPLFLRISATDWLEESLPNEPSWRSEDTVKLAPILAAHGVDLIDISTGGNDARQKMRVGPAYQLPFAEDVKRAVGSTLFVGAVGALHHATLAESIVAAGQADIIFVGRQFLKNPGLVWSIAEDLGVDMNWASQIGWAFTGRAQKALGTDKPKAPIKQ